MNPSNSRPNFHFLPLRNVLHERPQYPLSLSINRPSPSLPPLPPSIHHRSQQIEHYRALIEFHLQTAFSLQQHFTNLISSSSNGASPLQATPTTTASSCYKCSNV